MEKEFDRAKLALAIRAARAASGLTQKEFAAKIGLATTTLARLEVMDSDISAILLIKFINYFKDLGIDVDLFTDNKVSFTLTEEAISAFSDKMNNVNNRRTDKGARR